MAGRRKSKRVRGVYGGSATVQWVSQGPRPNDLYHWLLTTSTPYFFLALLTGYLGLNMAFATAYLACGDGILNARHGSFSDAFFFSVQTLATIGYGQMVPKSFAANLLVTAEAAIGMFSVATSASLVFARFTRPTAGIRFSKNAVVTNFDGKPTLMFRLANRRNAQIHEARVLVVLARESKTLEGQTYRRLHDLTLVRSLTPVFQLSWTVMHVIDEGSPFFRTNPDDLMAADTAFSVLFTGHHEGFRQTVHARHTYAASEIQWSKRFADLFSRNSDGQMVIDYTRFDDLVDS